METWKRALIAQIADQAEAFLAGRMTADQLLSNAWGLMDAADLRLSPTWDAFYRHWAKVDGMNELLTEAWAPPGTGSIEQLRAAAEELGSWAVATSVAAD